MLTHLKPTCKARNPFPSILAQQCRHRHQPPHRMINVQLLCDVHNLGNRGSIQPVAPGLMRSILYPQGKAIYLTRGVEPRLLPLVDTDTGTSSSKGEKVDFANIKSRLSNLAPLVFHRRLRNLTEQTASAPASPSGTGQPIYGSVTLHDITRRLSETHNLSLVPPNALLSMKEGGLKDKLKFTGMFDVHIHLRTGDIVLLKVLVEPEVGAKEQDKQQNLTTILPGSSAQAVGTRQQLA